MDETVPKRLKFRWLALAGSLVVAPWIVMYAVLSAYVGAPTLGSVTIWSCAYTVVLGVAVVLGRRVRRSVLRGLALSRERDGLVCPRCHGRPAIAPGEPKCCGRAPTDWSHDDYREWWRSVATGAVAPHALAGPRREGWRAFVPGIGALAMGLAGVLFGALPGGAWDTVSVIEAVLPFAFWGYGMDLFGRGVGGWRPGRTACAACGYLKVPGTTSRLCPECGANWSLQGGTRLERGPKDRRFIAAGIACYLIGLALMLTPFFGVVSPLRRLQSTSALIAAATTPGVMARNTNDAAWTELNRRTLTPAEERLLFHAVLDQRRHRAFMFGPPAVFVSTYLTAGNANDEDIRRYRREPFTPRLVHPSTGRVGEEIVVVLEGERHEEFLPPAVGVTIHRGWIRFEDEPEPPPHGGSGAWTLEIGQRKALPELRLRSDRAGERRFIARYWFVARSYGHLAKPIEWNEDGTPVLPTDALWAEPIDLEGTIRFEP